MNVLTKQEWIAKWARENPQRVCKLDPRVKDGVIRKTRDKWLKGEAIGSDQSKRSPMDTPQAVSAMTLKTIPTTESEELS